MPDHRSAALMTVMVSSPRRGHCPPSVHSACCPPSSPATLSPCHPLAHPPRALLVPTNQVAASPLPSPARSSVVGGASAVMEGRRWWGWSGVCLSRHRCRHLPPPQPPTPPRRRENPAPPPDLPGLACRHHRPRPHCYRCLPTTHAFSFSVAAASGGPQHGSASSSDSFNAW